MTGLVIERLSADSPWLPVVARWRHAASHAIAHLFLYTDAAEPFYARCGWAVQERFRADGMDCVLMKRDL